MQLARAGWSVYLQRYHAVVVLIVLSVTVLLFYAPILPGNFLSDDHVYIAHLLEYGRQYVQGNDLDSWFFVYNSPTFLRPLVQWFWLFNYLVWYTSATGFYLSNIFLHALNAFLVYLLVSQILDSKIGALFGSLLFALHPTHPDSVAWIADCVDLLAVFFSLLGALFFVLHRKRTDRTDLVVSVCAFALATLTKETTLVLPGVLIVYDLFYSYRRLGWNVLSAHIPLWGWVPAYFALRWAVLPKLFGNDGLSLAPNGWNQYLQYYVGALAQPFVPDMNGPLLQIILLCSAVLILLFRNSRAMWVGLGWVAGSLIPLSAVYMAARLVYLPSVGLAIVQAAIIDLLARYRRVRAAALAVSVFVSAVYGYALVARVSDWANAGAVASAIPQELRQMYSGFPANSILYFKGIPDPVREVYVYGTSFAFAVRNAYPGNPNFQSFAWAKFPLLTENLDHTYFFEYRQRKIIEHPEIRAALQRRRDCPEDSSPGIAWVFSHDLQGWEPWNQMSDTAAQDGALVARATGTDPFMASPAFDIPALSIGNIEITMRAMADSPVLHGAVYWMTESMEDFSPGLQAPFQVQADGDLHIYRVDLSSTGQLSFGEHIVRLRLDPLDAPADFAIRSIRIFTRCARAQ